jgi:hypothetical protein
VPKNSFVLESSSSGVQPEYLLGCAIAQAVSRQVPTEAAQVRAQVKSCWICGGQSGTGTGFLRVLRFPLQILIPPTAPHSSSISSGAGTIGQLVADVPSGLSLTPSQETKTKLNNFFFYVIYDSYNIIVLLGYHPCWLLKLNEMWKLVLGRLLQDEFLIPHLSEDLCMK